MASIGTVLRRTIFLVLVAAGIGMVVSWRRDQSTTPIPGAPPQWPPLTGSPPSEPVATWLPAHDDGTAPTSHPIKAKASSGIFHVPGGRFYDRTTPDRCYATAADAEADGYRQSKS
jgi:hypothetical protein